MYFIQRPSSTAGDAVNARSSEARSDLRSEDAAIEGDLLSSDEIVSNATSSFAVVDHRSAAWVVRKIVEARAHADRVRAWAAAELHRAERDERWLLHRFGPTLESWLRAELEQQGECRRSIALPAGTLGLRAQPARLHVIDEPKAALWSARHLPDAFRVVIDAGGPAAVELAAWQRLHPDISKQRQHVLRDALAQHVAETGELPDGTTLRPAADVFYVK